MIRYLHLDCEMGGRELRYSLLTAAFMVKDENFNVLGKLDLEVKPDDGDYVLSGQGMGVNKIDIIKHDLIAMPYKHAKPLLFNFLKQHAIGCKLVPVGHGVRGDIEHITGGRLISDGSWEQFCSYHYLDTSVILQYLRACGKMPLDCDGSVMALAKHFGIDISGELHNAMVDVETTAAVFEAMVRLGK